jgi:hypothetical protein
MTKSLADAKKQTLVPGLRQAGYELTSDIWQTYEAIFAKGSNSLAVVDHIKDQASVIYRTARRSFSYVELLRSASPESAAMLERALGGFDADGGFRFPDFEVISHVVVQTIAVVERHASNNLMQPTGKRPPAADQGR